MAIMSRRCEAISMLYFLLVAVLLLKITKDVSSLQWTGRLGERIQWWDALGRHADVCVVRWHRRRRGSRGHYIYTSHVGGICNSRINIVVGIKGVRRINTGRRAYCRRTARYRKNSDAVASSRSCFCRGTKLPHPCASHVATQSVGVLSNGGRRPPMPPPPAGEDGEAQPPVNHIRFYSVNPRPPPGGRVAAVWRAGAGGRLVWRLPRYGGRNERAHALARGGCP